MELRYAQPGDDLNTLWQLAFHEEGDLFFLREYDPARALVYADERENVVSMLHWVVMDADLWGEKLKCAYILGVATHPACRGRGLARDLMEQVLFELHLRKIPLAALLPASPALVDYYAQFGFRQCGAFQTPPIEPSRGRTATNADISALDRHYERLFGQTPRILRSRERWKAILSEYTVELLDNGYNVFDGDVWMEGTQGGQLVRHPGACCVRAVEAATLLAAVGRHGRPVPQTVYDNWCPWNILGGVEGDRTLEDELFERFPIYMNLLHN